MPSPDARLLRWGTGRCRQAERASLTARARRASAFSMLPDAPVITGRSGDAEGSARQPLVTILIATRNRLERLTHLLKSLQGQTYRNWEVVIIDDGSEPPIPPI